MADGMLGRDVMTYIYLGKSETLPTSNWLRFGACRDWEESNESETVDMSSDTSSGTFREYKTSYTTNSATRSGVLSTKESNNLDIIEVYKNDCSNAAIDPDIWIRVVRPKSGGETRTYEYPALLNKFSITGSYDGEVTWSADITQNGAKTITDV